MLEAICDGDGDDNGELNGHVLHSGFGGWSERWLHCVVECGEWPNHMSTKCAHFICVHSMLGPTARARHTHSEGISANLGHTHFLQVPFWL